MLASWTVEGILRACQCLTGQQDRLFFSVQLQPLNTFNLAEGLKINFIQIHADLG